MKSKPSLLAVLLLSLFCRVSGADPAAFQAFAESVSAVSCGHYGLQPSRILIPGHPPFTGRRGLNVMATQGDRVILRDRFDTYRFEEESDRLAASIAALPPGTMIVVVAHDDATRRLNDSARNALNGIGAGEGLRRLQYRDAYLLIGMKGLGRGRGIEKAGVGERVHGEFRVSPTPGL